MKLAVRIMPRDVSTRWNSTYDMLDFAIQYRHAVDVMTDKRKLGLGAYELSDDEWTLVEQLRDVLKACHTSCDPLLIHNTYIVFQILKHATLFFSRGTPNLAMVIPAMDHIDTVFTNGIINTRTLNPAIRAALGVAKRTLNKYYSLTDSSETYRIAMGTF